MDQSTAELKAESDLKELQSFMEAYPHPGYELKATREEELKVDEDYNRLMRTHGIDPDKVTSLEFNQAAMKELIDPFFAE